MVVDSLGKLLSTVDLAKNSSFKRFNSRFGVDFHCAFCDVPFKKSDIMVSKCSTNRKFYHEKCWNSLFY